jgi:Skp family chaperone for outer membrane proteins
MSDNDLKTARATLRKVQARHADLQTLQRDAQAEVEMLQTTDNVNLDTLATAQSRATAAAQLLSKAQLEVDTATTSLRQCERAHTRSQRLEQATDHAAQSAVAREQLDTALKKGSDALASTISDVMGSYDGLLEARAAFTAMTEGDDLLTTELARSGVRCATTPDAERGAHLHELGTLAPLIWQAVSRALDDRHTAARAVHAKSRARAREKAIKAARAEREARNAEHLAQLAAQQRMREGSETDRARRNNSSFSLDLGGE